jgi:hypothetical protein
MIRSTRVALRGYRGVSKIPLAKLFSGVSHKFLAGFDGDHQAVWEVATSKSNKPTGCNSIT